jgi:hypothetical protein
VSLRQPLKLSVPSPQSNDIALYADGSAQLRDRTECIVVGVAVILVERSGCGEVLSPDLTAHFEKLFPSDHVYCKLLLGIFARSSKLTFM